MNKNKVGKERKGKVRKGKEENGLAFSPIRGGQRGWVRSIIFCTGVKVSNIMTCAHFGVDFLRGVGFCGGTNLVFPLYSVVGPYNCSTNVLLWYVDTHPGVQSNDNDTMLCTYIVNYEHCGENMMRIAVMTTVVCEPWNIIEFFLTFYLNLVCTDRTRGKLGHGMPAMYSHSSWMRDRMVIFTSDKVSIHKSRFEQRVFRESNPWWSC